MDLSELVSESRKRADNFDKHRSPWESVTHWHVRKRFLLHNWNEFKDKDRLICLSQAWVNVQFSGNRYPHGVMEELKRLQEGLDPADKMLRDAELQVIGTIADPPKVNSVHDTSRMPRTLYPMRFIKQESKMKTEESNIVEKDVNRSDDIVSKRKRPQEKTDSSNIDASTKSAKIPRESCTESVADTNQHRKVDVSSSPATDCKFSAVRWKKVTLNQQQKQRLKDLVLRQRCKEPAISVINSSAEFCKLATEYVFEEDFISKEYCCCLYVNDVLVGQAYAGDKKSSKHAAAVSGLELLRSTQPTVLISELPGNLDSALSRNDVLGRPSSEIDRKIEDSNIGNQLLRKMGWNGQGGLGKSGSGISAPVTVNEAFGRAGLGSEMGGDKLITFKDAHQIIKNYAASESNEDLTFSPELTNEERAKIHKLASRYGLKSKSYNKDNIRYLVVSRKKSAMGLVEELEMCGGKLGGLELIRPGEKRSVN